MTIATITSADNHTFDCGGAQVRAYCRPLATVVTVRGEIDATNVDLVSTCIRRFILRQSPVVLDMSGVSPCAAAGIPLLRMVDEACDTAAVEWTLVTSPAITELLGDGDEDMFPMTRSVHEALHNLADAIADRRQLVLPLNKKTA